MGIFKRKTEAERVQLERDRILLDYIKECRKAGFLDETILRKLRDIKVPKEFLNKHFELNLIKEVINNMPKQIPEEDYEEEQEEDNEVEEEQEPEEDDEVEEEPVIIKKKVVRPTAKVEKKETSTSESDKEGEELVSILKNHEERIRNLESAIFRLKAI